MRKVTYSIWKKKQVKGLCMYSGCRNHSYIDNTSGEEFDCCLGCYKKSRILSQRQWFVIEYIKKHSRKERLNWTVDREGKLVYIGKVFK